MKYAIFDAVGLPVAFYAPEIVTPPAGAMQITDAQWQEMIDNAGQRRWDGAAVVAYEPPPAAPLVPASISRRQFFQQAAIDGIITEDDALAAVSTGALPSVLQALVDAAPAGEQFAARMALAAQTIERSHPLTATIAAALTVDADAFFIAAGAL